MISTIGRGLLVLMTAALVGAAAYLFSTSQSKEYVATSELGFSRLVSPELQVLGGDFSEPQIDADVRIATEAEGVNSFDVAVATARMSPTLGLRPGQIASRVDATPVRGSLVVRVTSTGETPDEAARIGDAYVTGYLSVRRDRERSRAATVESALRRRLATTPTAARKGPIGATIRNQLSAVGVLKRVGSGTPEVVETARASSVASQPQTTRNVLFGAVFGLLVGVGLVALRAQARSRDANAARERLAAVGTPRRFDGD